MSQLGGTRRNMLRLGKVRSRRNSGHVLTSTMRAVLCRSGGPASPRRAGDRVREVCAQVGCIPPCYTICLQKRQSSQAKPLSYGGALGFTTKGSAGQSRLLRGLPHDLGRGVANFSFSHLESLERRQRRKSPIRCHERDFPGNSQQPVLDDPGSGGLTKMNGVPLANENERDAETLFRFGNDSEVSATNLIDLAE